MFLYPWGDMHSLNLGWFLLQFKDWVEKIQEYLDNGGGTSENLANVIAPVFNAANSYLTGDYVLYNNELYKALEPVPAGTWNPDAWARCLVTEEMGSASSGVDNVARLMIAAQYSNTYNYQKYAICRYSDKLWMCNTNLPAGGEEWTPSHWDEITVGAGLTGLRRSVETLQNEIENLDSDDVTNQSENVPGDNVTDAIDSLFAAINNLPLTDGKKYKICCGALRNSGSGWSLINDSGHTPINVSSVSVNANGDIVVNFNFTSSKIKTFICSPDETFAGLYRIGASVGATSAILQIHKLPEIIGGMTQYNAATQSWSDTFLNGIHYESAGSGVIQMRLNDSRSLYPVPYNANEIYSLSVECRYSVGMIHSIGADGIQFKCFAPDTGLLIPTNGWQDEERAFISWNLPEKKMNANNVSDPQGNFWFFGLFEVQ